MICVDTNVLIGVLNRRDTILMSRFDREVENAAVAIPSVCLFELEYGIAKSKNPSSSAQRLLAIMSLPVTVLPFEAADAREAGAIRADLDAKAHPSARTTC